MRNRNVLGATEWTPDLLLLVPAGTQNTIVQNIRCLAADLGGKAVVDTGFGYLKGGHCYG